MDRGISSPVQGQVVDHPQVRRLFAHHAHRAVPCTRDSEVTEFAAEGHIEARAEAWYTSWSTSIHWLSAADGGSAGRASPPELQRLTPRRASRVLELQEARRIAEQQTQSSCR